MRSLKNRRQLVLNHKEVLKGSRLFGPSLMGLPSVQFITYGVKRTDGQITDEPAIVAYVMEKGNTTRQTTVPKNVSLSSAGKKKTRIIKTDVENLLRPPRIFGAEASNILSATDGSWGTCTFAFQRGGQGYLLTNAHVATRANVPRSVGIIDPPTHSRVPLGPVVWASQLIPGQKAAIDAAVIRSSVPVDPGRIAGHPNPVVAEENLVPNSQYQFWYSVGGAPLYCVQPEYVLYTQPINVDGLPIVYADFFALRMTGGACAPGHSGALLCRDSTQGPVAAGQIFGGADPTIVWAFSFKKMFDFVYLQHF